MALEFIHRQKRRQSAPWDHVLLVAAVTMSLFSAVDSSRCHCELQNSVCCAHRNACEADGKTIALRLYVHNKEELTLRNGPSYSCSQQLLPPIKRLCFHRCPSVGWLVCEQDHTKATAQSSTKGVSSKGLHYLLVLVQELFLTFLNIAR